MRIAEPQRKAVSRRRGDKAARSAVYTNRMRLRSDIGKEPSRRQAEVVERSFAHTLERGGMQRMWLRGRENVRKRYLIHVAGHNLELLLRLLIGAGAPKAAVARLVPSGPAPDPPWRRCQGHSHGSRRPQRHASRNHL